jgi:tetratricopeptide (TPR) repeat protein
MTRRPSDLARAAGMAAGGTPDPSRSIPPPHDRPAAVASIKADVRAGNLARARETARALVARNKRDAEAHFLLAAIAERSRDLAAARDHARKAVAIKPQPEALMILARFERQAGHTDASLGHCDHALALKPGHVPYLVHRAGALEEAGRFAEARAVVDPLVESFEAGGEPLPGPLRFELAKLLVQEKSYDRAVEVIDLMLDDASTPRDAARMAYYLKAKACDRSKRYDDAFEVAGLGNEIGRLEFDPKLYEDQVSTLIEIWSPERMERFPLAACDDELPVFVAGMPRSGTSLIDQIIDAHPRAAGVGELASIEAFAARLSRAYDPEKEPPGCFGDLGETEWTRVANDYARNVKKLAPAGTERVVNKALGNNKLVGLLSRLFPRTRVIHALRDPRDVAISCYMGGFNNRMHAWTTRIEWAACAWEQSRRMMEHWRSSLDIPILDVRYEELVRDPDTQFPRLIEFLGLEWDDACRDFYKSKRTVRTLSYDQVNRPIYTTSAGRNANYADHIAGVGFPAY